MKPACGRQQACSLVHAGFLFRLFFDPEDGDDVFLRNIGWHSTVYTASYPRRWYSSYWGQLASLREIWKLLSLKDICVCNLGHYKRSVTPKPKFVKTTDWGYKTLGDPGDRQAPNSNPVLPMARDDACNWLSRWLSSMCAFLPRAIKISPLLCSIFPSSLICGQDNFTVTASIWPVADKP
jgi:hypothetical protein